MIEDDAFTCKSSDAVQRRDFNITVCNPAIGKRKRSAKDDGSVQVQYRVHFQD